MITDNRFAFQKLDCYGAAREFAKGVHEAGIRDAELRDQATRAAKSAFLGLCEGLPNEQAGLRRRYFTQANNSLHEAVGVVDLASAIGAVSPEAAEELQALAWRLKRMLRALTVWMKRPRPTDLVRSAASKRVSSTRAKRWGREGRGLYEIGISTTRIRG
jgi:four helix bundle protein